MTDSCPSCLEALLNLYPYLDGELDAKEAEKVRLHFELCTPCTPALHYLQSFRSAVKRAAEDLPPAPLALRERIAQLLEAQ